MDILFSTIAVVFAAFLVWLAVRIVNRRERWAKRLAWGIAIFVTLYPLRVGPSVWLYVHVVPEPYGPAYLRAIAPVYGPLEELILRSQFAMQVAHRYRSAWASDDDMMDRLRKDENPKTGR
jgi:hypothetical protein